ncbi:fumarate hydratase C-terminal domain-containing protein [Candidatus Saganbacteria bacterium]|nr:fumarate hydratase C-terminal domain-containing protein [Candidatus Saganbacteria bacterium]
MQKLKRKNIKTSKGKTVKLSPPLTDKDIAGLKVGDTVLITGTIYCARDSAHKLFGDKPPFPAKGSVIYYASPTPTPPGAIIGSIGPTTSTRMDKYAPDLLKAGVKATIGKGRRSQSVIDAQKKYNAVYLAIPGGTAAALAKNVKKATVIAYPELGPEAVLELEVVNFPTIVTIDAKGNDLFEIGKEKYHEGT